MNPERWAAVKSLYLKASTLPTRELANFFDNLQQADEEISNLVCDLLSQESAEGPDVRHPCWLETSPATTLRAFQVGQKLLGRFEITGFSVREDVAKCTGPSIISS